MTVQSTFRNYKTAAEFRDTLFLTAEEGVLPIGDVATMFQKRAEGTDQALVKKYQEAMASQIETEGEHRFPPLDICVVEEPYGTTAHLVDGYHRYYAMLNLGFTEVPVRIAMNCFRKDAEFYAVSSNMQHGKTTTTNTVGIMVSTLISPDGKGVEEMLEDYERWVDVKKATTNKKELAAYVGCSKRVIELLPEIQEYDGKLTKARDLKIKLAKDEGLNNSQISRETGIPRKTIVDQVAKNEAFANRHPKSLFDNDDSDATATSEGSYIGTGVDLECPWDDEDFENDMEQAKDLKDKMAAIEKANARGFNTMARDLGEPSKHSGLTQAEKALNSVRNAHASLEGFANKHDLSELAACLADDENMKKHVDDLGLLIQQLQAAMPTKKEKGASLRLIKSPPETV